MLIVENLRVVSSQFTFPFANLSQSSVCDIEDNEKVVIMDILESRGQREYQ